MSIDEIANWLSTAEPGSPTHGQMLAELTRRQTIAQLEATEAQRTAAEAEQEAARAATATAKSTERNVKYMFWSVIAAAVSAVVTALGIAWNVFNHH